METLLPLASSLLGSAGSTAPAASGPVTFGNVTQSGGNTGLSTTAVIGIAAAVVLVLGGIFLIARRKS